jgi:hypothetical protein
MPRNQDRDRANLGEQADMAQTDVERQDRSMGAGARGDGMAGAEGIEDPAMEQPSHESMETGSSERSGRASSRDLARASKRARRRSRRRTDESTSFSGQGWQKEGSSMNEEGTGYTGRSNTDQSESENR